MVAIRANIVSKSVAECVQLDGLLQTSTVIHVPNVHVDFTTMQLKSTFAAANVLVEHLEIN
jgi:hypothetical protein